jgi:hypothetical protein
LAISKENFLDALTNSNGWEIPRGPFKVDDIDPGAVDTWNEVAEYVKFISRDEMASEGTMKISS